MNSAVHAPLEDMWLVRNEVLHVMPVPPVDVYVRFLSSYLASLTSMAVDPNVDQVKGKTVLSSCSPRTHVACNNSSPSDNMS